MLEKRLIGSPTWQLAPQKPLQRACQRNPEAIDRWQRGADLGIALRAWQAKATGADFNCWDESGCRADTVCRKTWAPKRRSLQPVLAKLAPQIGAG